MIELVRMCQLIVAMLMRGPVKPSSGDEHAMLMLRVFV